MDWFSAIGKVVQLVVDLANAPAEKHAEIVANWLASEKDALAAVILFNGRTAASIDATDARIAEMEKRHEAEVAAHQETKTALADLKAQHQQLVASIDLAKPVP